MARDLLAAKRPTYSFGCLSYHDSWLSIDPVIGCSADCAYCYMQATGWTAVSPERIMSVGSVVDELVGHRLFVPGQTILSYGNHTDAFLGPNLDGTAALLEALEARGLTNALVIATKRLIPDELLALMGRLKRLRPIVAVSHSGLPRSIERGVAHEEAIETLRRLADRGLRRFHFWRPLLRANSHPAVLRSVLDAVAPYAQASVYCGLQFNPTLRPLFSTNPDLAVPETTVADYGESLPADAERSLRDLAASRAPEYPVYKHTSCAVSYVLRLPDYNATFHRGPLCTESRCPSWKRAMCEAASAAPNTGRIASVLGRLGTGYEFEVREGYIVVRHELDQNEYAFALHNLNYPILAPVRRSRNLWGTIYPARDMAAERRDL